MKTVILMRHAKSSWSDPTLDDHDRPLNKRGRASAPVMAKWLAKRKQLPERILSSSSERTRETVALMREAVPALPEAEFHETLYHAEAANILEHLRRLPKSCKSVMLLGHEPSMSMVLRMLDPSATAPELIRAYDHYPTAAIAVLDSDIKDWRELGTGKERLVSFVIPRELTD